MEVVKSASGLRKWAMLARQGEVAEYHCGHLASACSYAGSSARALELERLRQEALALLDAGLVTLAQARHDPRSFSYRAIRLAAPAHGIQA